MDEILDYRSQEDTLSRHDNRSRRKWTTDNEMCNFVGDIAITGRDDVTERKKKLTESSRENQPATIAVSLPFSPKDTRPFGVCISKEFTRKSQLCFSLFSRLFSGAFRLYDVDNDGFITRDEMYNIVDAIYQMVVSALLSKNLPGPRGSLRRETLWSVSSRFNRF